MFSTCRFFVVRNGEGSRYVKAASSGGFCAIECELDNLAMMVSFDEIKRAYSERPSECRSCSLDQRAGVAHRFSHAIQAGDVILSPNGQGKLICGIAGLYYFHRDVSSFCPLHHRRYVKWFPGFLLRTKLSPGLRRSLSSSLAVFSIEEHTSELRVQLTRRFLPNGQ